MTDKTLQAVEKLFDSLKKLGIKYVDGELIYDEEETGLICAGKIIRS
ncbi:MAG: hypothetical protein WBO49_02590 [Candidatus Saccharimonas sp.]